MSALSIGLSGILTSQRLLDITGQNIANANNPAYHRQTANLAARMTGNPLGAGVYITDVRRSRSALLESAVMRNTVEEQNVTTQFNAMRQLEVFLAPGEDGVDGLIEKFFNQMQELAASPGDMAQRRVVLGTATSLADRLNTATNELRQLSEDIDSQARALVSSLNTIADQVAELNGQIMRASVLQQQPNDLLDQRDALIGQLSQMIDVQVVTTEFNKVNVIAAGAPIVVGAQSLHLQYQVDSTNQGVFARADQSSQALNVTGGQAAGLMQIRNNELQSVRDRLDTLSQGLVASIDNLHATGLGLTGPMASANGYRVINDATIPLDQTNLAFPPQAGRLFVSMTNTATGARTVHEIALDPATQSLDDVATALSAIPNLTASVNPTSNTLQLVADSGIAFDFAGRLPTQPTNLAVTGTSVPQINGTYTGSANENYTFTVVGSGTVGVTPGLLLEVRDSGNNLLGSFNIGEGYEPGSALPAVNGVVAKMGAGTLNNGDSFETPVIGNADEAKILTALGVNTFFAGDSASTLKVRPDLVNNPALLSASKTGEVGEGSNLVRMARLRDTRSLAGGTQNFREYYASLVSDVGVRVQNLGGKADAKQALGQRLEAERQAVSGVDPNEELLRMLQYQRSFQMAARYLVTVNETLDSLLQLVG